MALRELLLPWDAQPQDLPDVDPAFGIAEAWLPHLSPVGLVASAIPSTEATYTLRPTARGLGLNVTANGRRYSRPYFSGQSNYAWLAVLHRDGSGTRTCSVLRQNLSATPVQEASNAVHVALWPGGVIRFQDYQTAGGNQFTNYQNKVTVFAGRVDSAAATLYTLLDGVITASTVTSGAGTLATTTNPLTFGATESGGEVATPWANLQTLLWFGSIPSEAVLHDLMRDSWRVFRRRIFVPVSAGGGAAADLATTGNSGTFSGTANSPATATLAATGASGALSASAGTSASAALAATGDSGTLSASAYTPALASLAATGGSGIFVGSAFSEATAALSATGGSGTLSASAGAEASASLAATGGSGTLAADAFVQAVATLAATGVSGSLIASAWTTISATLSATGGSGELTASAGEPVVATRVLSSYRPLPPPADPKDVGRWAMNEFLTIARHLADGRDFDLLNTIHAQPSKPREGMVVHADGTNWDPGSGAGRYERVGGAWVKL